MFKNAYLFIEIMLLLQTDINGKINCDAFSVALSVTNDKLKNWCFIVCLEINKIPYDNLTIKIATAKLSNWQKLT